MTTPFLIQGQYQPGSDATITVEAATPAGSPLNDTNTVVKVTAGVTGDYADTSLANALAATYSGTPGKFTYTILAASLPRGPKVYWFAAVNDLGGATHFTVWGEMTPVV